jgi:uncharacterized protein YdaU (DUF1376 family)
LDSSPAFQLYTKDLLADGNVLAMSLEQFGAYMKLLALCWQERGLEADPDKLARILRVSRRRFDQLWPELEPCFYQIEGRWQHKRLDQERDKQAKFREHQSRVAARRWGSGGDKAADGKERRRLRLADARLLGTHTAEEWDEMKSAYGRCLKCGALTTEPVKDHIVPIYQGGSDAITNLQPLCRNCNSAKGPDSTDYRLNAPETLEKWLPEGCRKAAERLPESDDYRKAALQFSSSFSNTRTRKDPNIKIAHQGPRLTVWKWQHEDLGKRLGSKPFDLLGWYSKLEAELEKTGESLADPWRWLISRLVRDAGLEYPNLYGKPGRRPNEPCPAGHTPPCVSVEACRERRQAEREAARAAKAAQA